MSHATPSTSSHRTLTDRDTYEIIVDIDGWPASRAALSEVVAAVLGVPSHRIRPVLDVRDEPVAAYAHQEEADRIAEELAARGIDVVVRRRIRKRKSLRELTKLANTSVPRSGGIAKSEPAPKPAEAPESPEPEAPSRTMKPGWSALAESGPMSLAPAGTAVGLPAWSDPAEPTTAPPHASQNAIDPRDVSALLEAEATADTVDPGAQAGVWGDILGAALADRLVGTAEELSGETFSASPQPAGLDGSGSVAVVRAKKSKARSTEASPEAAAAPPTQETLAPSLGGDTQHPSELRAQLAAGAETTPASDEPAADGKSAWAVAGVDVPPEVVNAPKGVLRPVATIDQPEPSARPDLREALARFAGDELAFAGFDEAALAEAEAQVHDELTVGDKFVRLRQPSPDELVGTPEPNAVLGWGLLAPGGGFAALGEPVRGLNYALGAIFVVPWLKGALDASRAAADVKAGKVLLQRKPDPLVLFLYVVGFWGIAACVGLGVSALLAPSEPPPNREVFVEIDTGSQTSVVESDSTTDQVVTDAADAEPEIDETERQRQLDRLIREARLACEEERYAECERLAGQALDLDGRNRQALILQVESVSRGVRSAPERPPETENDRQPDRPTP